jgi:hypothetical protein
MPRHAIFYKYLSNSNLGEILFLCRDYDYSLKYDFPLACYDKS